MKMRTAGSRFVGLLFAVLVCVLHFTGFAEASTTWMKTYTMRVYKGIYAYDSFFLPNTIQSNVIKTADGGYIAVGNNYSVGYALVFKVDGRGDLVWQRAYASSGQDYANSIQQTPDGGFIVAGSSAGGASVLKLDGSGNIVWQKTYGGSGSNSAAAIRQTADGGFIMAGAGITAWKLDAQGEIEWQKVYGNAAGRADIRQTPDGGYIVVGDWWVGKLNAGGDIEWQKMLQAEGRTILITSVQETHDGVYAVAGSTVPPDPRDGRPCIVKLDASGNILQQKIFSYYGLASAIERTADGGYVVAGTTNYPGTGWISKLDANWDVEWGKNLQSNDFNDYNKVIRGVQQTADGGYIVSGLTNAASVRHAWLTKLDSNGNIAGCAAGLVTDYPTVPMSDAIVATDAFVGSQAINYLPQAGSSYIVTSQAWPFQMCTETAPAISVSPSSLAFGNIEVGSLVTGMTTVTNDVNYPLAISSISVDGAEFGQTNNCSTVPGFGSCSITVTFAPGSVGAKSATIIIASDDPVSPTVFVPLTGTGVKVMYTINASAGPNGSISPSGTVTAYTGDNRTFSIVPAAGYYIADVLVDGASVGAVTSYTFSNIRANHTIMATFSQFLSVTAPNGGESWKRGTTQTIRWTYAGNPGSYVKIELLKGGAVNSTITSKTSIGTNGSGSYNWRIPSKQATGSDYTIRVTSTSNSNYKDTSDGTFTITP